MLGFLVTYSKLLHLSLIIFLVLLCLYGHSITFGAYNPIEFKVTLLQLEQTYGETKEAKDFISELIKGGIQKCFGLC